MIVVLCTGPDIGRVKPVPTNAARVVIRAVLKCMMMDDDSESVQLDSRYVVGSKYGSTEKIRGIDMVYLI